MARLRSSLAPTLPPAVATEEAAERRWRAARRLFMAHDPGTPGQRAYVATRAEHDRLTRLDLTHVERMAALDVFLAEHGWLDTAAYRRLERTTR